MPSRYYDKKISLRAITRPRPSVLEESCYDLEGSRAGGLALWPFRLAFVARFETHYCKLWDMGHCMNCGHRAEAAANLCSECRRVLFRMAPQHQHYSRPPTKPPRASRKPRSTTGLRKAVSVVAARFERLRRRGNKGQMIVVLALGLLLMLMAVFSSMRGGEEDGGEMRTKSLVYDADSYGKIGLYWMDDKANMRKATSEEVNSCEKLHPNEAIPICQTTYYEKDEDKQ